MGILRGAIFSTYMKPPGSSGLFTAAEVSTVGADRPAPKEDASVVCAKLVPKQQMGDEVLLC